jgi:hypothetical protein
LPPKYRLWKVCLESSITMFSQGVSVSRCARCTCYHRWCDWPTYT